MRYMVVTLGTSHAEMSPLNEAVTSRLSNRLFISVTADTFQDPIGPSGPLEQSADSFRHTIMAAVSSALDPGTHPVEGVLYQRMVMLRVRFRDRAGAR